MLSTGFSFAANDANILYCNLEEFSIQDDPTKGLDTFHCEDKDWVSHKDVDISIKDLKNNNGYYIWDLWYNNVLIKKDVNVTYVSVWTLWYVAVEINNTLKTIRIGFWWQIQNASFLMRTSETVWFDGEMKYRTSTKDWINPYIKFENKNYATRIYFSDASKKYITNPTNKNKYNALYMQIYNKSNKKITQKVLYSFAPIAFNDNNVSWLVEPVTFKIDLIDNWKDSNAYTFQTNTRNIKVDINNPLNPIVTKK